MNDTFITVIAIFLTAVLLFVFPVLTMADKLDDASNAKVDTITSNFVSEIQMTGKLTLKDYNSFIEELASTGNTYDVNMEIKILDENPGKKASQTDKDKIGENVYYSIYTTQIKDILESSDNNNQYTFKEGDLIKVTVKNTNLTLSQQLKNWLYTVAGNDTYTVSATESAMVATNGGDLVYTSEKSDGSDKNQAENENKLLYELRENNSSGRILKTGEWTNCNVWVKLWAKDDYKLDLEYYWKYKNKTTYSRVEQGEDGYTLTIPNESSINVYWKHSTLEKYSIIETIDMHIERERPTIEEVIGSTKKGNSGTITINGINDTGGSGVYGYYISKSSETPDATSSNWVPNSSSSVRKPVEKNGTYYVWVKDKAGNISDRKSCTVSGIVPPVETVTISNKMVLKNRTVTFVPQLTGGTEYSKIEFTSSNTNIARVDNNGNATGINAGNTTIRCTVTNFNGTTCSAEATLRVVEVAYNPNGGTLDLPYNNGKFATLNYNVTTNINGDITEREYAWNNSSITGPSSWTKYANSGQATLTTNNVGKYYLWSRLTDVNGNVVTCVSNEYNVRKNNIDVIEKYILENKLNIYNITFEPNGWTNQNITTTVNLNIPDELREAVNSLTIETCKDGINWEKTNIQNFTEVGTLYIRLYDQNSGRGAAYSTCSVQKIDRKAPTYMSAEIKNKTISGYDVYIYGVQDSQSGINRVQFPTWTTANGQDDLFQNWENNSRATGTKQSDGTTWIYHVNISDHNNEFGEYVTHIYIYDNVGNVQMMDAGKINVEHVHSFTAQGELRSNATCTEAATYWKKCSICNLQSTTEFLSFGSALEHNYVEGGLNPVQSYVTSQKACTQKGHKNCTISTWEVQFNCCYKTGTYDVHSTRNLGPNEIWNACHGSPTCTRCSRCGARP